MFTSFYSINGGHRFEGVTATTHNAALVLTRKLFSGEGYRRLASECHTGHLVLQKADGTRLVIDIEASA
jgi:hypothetical protein